MDKGEFGGENSYFFCWLIFENSSVCLGDLVFGGQFGVSGSPLRLFYFFSLFFVSWRKFG